MAVGNSYWPGPGRRSFAPHAPAFGRASALVNTADGTLLSFDDTGFTSPAALRPSVSGSMSAMHAQERCNNDHQEDTRTMQEGRKKELMRCGVVRTYIALDLAHLQRQVWPYFSRLPFQDFRIPLRPVISALIGRPRRTPLHPDHLLLD